MLLKRKTVNTPVGNLRVVVDDSDRVCCLTFHNDERIDSWHRSYLPDVELKDTEFEHPLFEQLEEYFAGTRTEFDVKTANYGTEFQNQIYEALRSIPYGETRSYSEIAHQIDAPKAVRAVGAANGQNPISIVNPCHRVIGADGALRGFAGGVEIKRALLDLEGAACLAQRELF